MKSTLLSLAALAGFVYVCFCAYLYFFQRSFIYFPVPAARNVSAEELWLNSGDARIRIWRLNAQQEEAILYFGGNAEDVALNIAEFTRFFPGKTLYLVNYRGYGGSSGSPDEQAFYRDAEAVFDLAKASHTSISVIGRSIGAAVATHLATARPVERLVLITPFDTLAHLAREYYPIFPTSLLLKDRFDSVSRADRIGAPVLFLVAERDEIIPYERSEALAAAMDPSLVTVRIIRDTGHNTIGTAAEYGRALSAFMAPGAGQ